MRRLTNTSGGAGFTLLEVLVSLALLSLLVVTMSSALYDARKASSWAERKSRDAEIGSVRLLLSRIVAEARPIKAIDPLREEGPLIDGRTDRLRLVTSFSAGGASGGLNETLISLRRDDAGGVADLTIDQVLFRQPGSPFGTVAPHPLHARLQQNVAGLSFRYFGRTEPEAPARWYASWRHPTRLPMLIEITLAMPERDTRRWPPLMIPLGLAER